MAGSFTLAACAHAAPWEVNRMTKRPSILFVAVFTRAGSIPSRTGGHQTQLMVTTGIIGSTKCAGSWSAFRVKERLHLVALLITVQLTLMACESARPEVTPAFPPPPGPTQATQTVPLIPPTNFNSLH